MSETQDTKTRKRNRNDDDTTSDNAASGLPDEQDTWKEPMRRDHFPVEKGDNQQDDDYLAEFGNPSGLSEQNVKWPEVDSQEALDDKIDEEQTDKADKIRDAARDADLSANDRESSRNR
jgi:hypothetical protein